MSESLSAGTVATGRRSPLALNRDELSSTYNSFFLEYTVFAEYARILQHPVSGVYVLPSDMSPLIWYGLLCVRSGLYQGATFKFTLLIPANHPDGGCPEFDFQAGVFHPLVDADTGQLDTRRQFPRWRRDVNHIHQLLSYATKVFNQIDINNPLNADAARLYSRDLEAFRAKVQESIDSCRAAIETPDPSDPHSIRIGEWTVEVMKAARTEIFEPEYLQDESVRNAQTSGLSWVQPGSLQPFSKTDSTPT